MAPPPVELPEDLLGVLIPGSTTWREAIPIFVVAVALLFVPGTVAALAARVKPLAAAAVGPVLTTSFLTVSGVVCGALGIAWTSSVLVVSLALCVVVVGALGRWLSRRHTLPDGGPLFASLVGVAAALAIVLLSIRKEIDTPEAIPQHPDTIFHLGAAQWMLEHGDISVLHAAGFASPSGTGFYPAAFHTFTASIAMLTGSSVVVATTVFVLAVVGIAWPLGCIALAMSLLGRRSAVAVSAGVASACFTGYPYFLMGFGVLWPNLFGQALLPAALLLVMSVVGSLARPPFVAAPRRTAALPLAVSLPGVALAHPNAFVAMCVFAALIVLGRALAFAWSHRTDRRRLAGGIGIVVGVLLVGAVGLVLRPASMFDTGAPGPEESAARAWHDLLIFAPRETKDLTLLAVLVLVGVFAMLGRHRGSRWVVLGLGVFLALFWLNVAVDSPAVRFFTWPWYNNAVRLQSVAILPAVIAATAAFVLLGDLAARVIRARHAGLAVTGVALLVFLAVTHGYVGAHEHILHRYFHPKPADSWVSDQELRSLRALSAHLPPDAVVAANPWNGATYLYVVSGRRLLIPTEKADTSTDRQLLAKRLDEVGSDPAVCAAAEREDVDWAITGGQPFSWANGREKRYAGIDDVGSSSAWRQVATAAPYTLYERVACAR
ncbi:MAG: hypothetical protein L0H79_01780 [Intrasporangium sp.]|uniref:DUF6541 family protein n=1 Tax=Intrasporangium sp. TaxID=1925024 RepID=UPI002647094D|nr:DUF6541 family protein [Intrasporangium sp.]MDN5794466.1 hypothetical protein [Intrasporangium sp.]